ncbi:hypothetical protein C8R45DRAFT_926581 [Mycena sanguinolenta]|nr:hypothetical protein C8R45DRAFT_926581 [Mycena sanguinolenta]
MSTSAEISSKIVLVMLATGKQGTGLVRALARSNDSALPDPAPWTILAQTRDISAPKSVALAALRGVHLIQGSPDTPETLFAAAPGPVYGVYSVQLGLDSPNGLDAEMKQARALADAAAVHGVRHFIYAGTNFGGIAGNRTNVPHTHPALPTTVLRLATFMDQLVQGDPASAIMFICQLTPSTRVQFVAASCCSTPRRRVAGGLWRGDAAADGRRERAELDCTHGDEGFAADVQGGYNVDIDAARKMHPEMKDRKTFLRTEAPKPAWCIIVERGTYSRCALHEGQGAHGMDPDRGDPGDGNRSGSFAKRSQVPGTLSVYTFPQASRQAHESHKSASSASGVTRDNERMRLSFWTCPLARISAIALPASDGSIGDDRECSSYKAASETVRQQER